MADVIPFDPWAALRLATRARIGLGRAGDAQPTTALLDFELAHAQARDAVQTIIDSERLLGDLPTHPIVRVSSRAGGRQSYLRHPDLGRCLSDDRRALLQPGEWDVVFVIADGLSAQAVNDHAAATLQECWPLLQGWRIAPIVIAEQARVALGDDIAASLNARMVVVLIGERPGLSVANSLGIYLTWQPFVGRKDSDRNCISNIHGNGLSPAEAARKIIWLMTEARRRGLTGIALKEEADGGVFLP